MLALLACSRFLQNIQFTQGQDTWSGTLADRTTIVLAVDFDGLCAAGFTQYQ